MKVTVLGCGGSGGVPLADGNWGLCKPDNPSNRQRTVKNGKQSLNETFMPRHLSA